MKQGRRWKLTMTILSLSLLTVMAGAAVAPALDVIRQYFAGESKALVQLIISMPALFIAITNLIFPKLAARFKSKGLVIAGLVLYVAGGCLAGVCDRIGMVLVFRAVLGIGTGIIMPMSTGLIAFYYTRDKQDKLMGYSSAMNQMGGVVATLISGFLAGISWRASFLVYLMGLICVALCAVFLPDERIGERETGKVEKAKAEAGNSGLKTEAGNSGPSAEAGNTDSEKKSTLAVFRIYYAFVIAMILHMFTFFVYPSSFAMECAGEGVVSANAVTVIMAMMDMVAFTGGLAFVHVRKHMGINTRILAPIMFAIGYALLAFLGGWTGTLAGSVLIGFANGLGIPMIIATASKKAGRSAGVTVLPLISMALYAAQFVTPFILSAAESVCGSVSHLPYLVALTAACIAFAWSFTIKETEYNTPAVRQE